MEDQRLVQLALSRGYVTPSQVELARVEQKSLADRGVEHGLYFILQDLGFLTDEQARNLRRHMSSTQVRALEVEGFMIEGRLGSGGMGDVFRARHRDGRISAIKLLSSKLAQNAEYVHRFMREAKATQRLNHPHIVSTFSTGESLGTRYIIMELVDGPSLKTWLQDKGRLDQDRAIHLLRQMASALGHAWEHGVLHRDVKPANIILGPARPGEPEPFCGKLCDFGLARVWQQPGEDDSSHGQLTGTGLALGTPHYMSPEQASGDHDVDQRSDIYGLGATLFHALLGQTLYSGKSSAVIMYKQVTENVDLGLLQQLGTNPLLIELLGRMLEKRRDKRIASWVEVAAAASRLPVTPIEPPATPAAPVSITPAPQPQPPTVPVDAPPAAREPGTITGASRRRSWGLSLTIAGLITLALAATAGVMLGGMRGGPRAEPATFAAALAAASATDPAAREILLAPGRYRGPWQLGAAHRSLRLKADGPGVVLEGGLGQPALTCSPGLIDARVQGVSIQAASGQSAIEAIGGCHIDITDGVVDGEVVVSGGVVSLNGMTLSGKLTVTDRGAVSVRDGRIGVVLSERSDLRLEHTTLIGGLAVHGGGVVLDGVRMRADAPGPALICERARITIRDLDVVAGGTGIQARACELPEADGLSIRATGVSLDWQGERDPAWRWANFALATPSQGILLPPGGNGARPERLPR